MDRVLHHPGKFFQDHFVIHLVVITHLGLLGKVLIPDASKIILPKTSISCFPVLLLLAGRACQNNKPIRCIAF